MKELEEALKRVLHEILSLSEKYNKSTVFTIGIAPRKREKAFFPFIRESSLSIIGNVEVNRMEDAIFISKTIDGIVDYIIIDDEKKSKDLYQLTSTIKEIVKSSTVLTYKDNDAWVEATDTLITQFLNENLNKKALIFNINNLSIKLALKLCERGTDVYLIDTLGKSNMSSLEESLNFILPPSCPSKIYIKREISGHESFDIVIGFSIDEPVLTHEFFETLNPKTIILDAGIGSITEKGIEYALKKGFKVLRLDMRAGLSGNIINVMESYDLKHNVYGRKEFIDFNVIAGGFFGLKGDIVVDSIKYPTKVIGVADGKGHIMEESKAEEYKKRIDFVENKLIRGRILVNNDD